MTVSPKLRALFARCVRELEKLDADWAVGGALAMAAIYAVAAARTGRAD